MLQDARLAYADGNFTEAASLAASAVASAHNVGVAAEMIAIAKERQETFSVSIFARVGLLFVDPDADLAAAEAALAEGDTATALQKAQAALDGWGSASGNGLKLLAMATAVVGALCVGGWWGLHTLGQRREPDPTYRETDGHFLEKADSHANWRDWESQAKSDDG